MVLEATHIATLGFLLVLMLLVAVIDIRAMIIPDAINAVIFVSGLSASLILGRIDPISALTASAVGGGLLILVQVAFRSLHGYDGLGWGDVKFVAAAATWTGVEGLAFALLSASVSALVYVFGCQVRNQRFDRRRRFPFGPFLALGAMSVTTFQLLSGVSMSDVVDSWLSSLLSG